MCAQAAIKLNPLLRNGAYGIVMRGVQKCTRGCSSLRDRNRLPLCCIKLDTATDLYCGIGTISLFAARNAKKVIGVEIVENAIEDARKNAEFNSIDNVRFICGKSEEILEKLLDEEKIIPNKIILDPLRAGLDEKLIKKLLEIMPEKISYISCNSSTQARDLKLLKEKYKIEKIQPVDMFCNSIHVETIALIQRVKS